jgi:FecR protein
MTPPLDNLEPLALQLRADLPPPSIDLAAQRRRLERDPRARLRQGWLTAPYAAAFVVAAIALIGALGVWRSTAAVPGGSIAVREVSATGHRATDGSFVQLATGGLGRVLFSNAQDLSYELVSGSAHVSVVPRVGHHWSISAGPYVVSVIGTAFKVDFDAPNLVVEVEHGVVSVAGGRLSAPVRLEQGARLRVQSGSFSVDHDDAPRPSGAVIPADSAPGAEPATPSHDDANKKPSQDWEAVYGSGDYRKAVALAHGSGFEHLIGSLPEAKLVKLADASRLGGDEAGARSALKALESRFPGGPQALRAVFLLGTLDARSGSQDAAIAAFQKYLAAAPNGPFASEATGRLMQLYAGRGRSEEASQMAASYLKREPSGPYVRLARSLSKAP